jgi:hypothetical protein
VLLRDLQPVVHGLDGYLVDLLPLLLIVDHFLGVAVVQTVAIKSQVEFLLVGQIVEDLGLVGRGDVEEGLEAVGVGWVVEDEEF